MMHNPPHPGEVLKELYFEPLALSVTDVAEALDITRKTLSAILNKRSGISPLMALKLSAAFDTTPESWLDLQNQYDLWQTREGVTLPKIKRFFSFSVPKSAAAAVL
jgi:addiction module HigA family antidote